MHTIDSYVYMYLLFGHVFRGDAIDDDCSLPSPFALAFAFALPLLFAFWLSHRERDECIGGITVYSNRPYGGLPCFQHHVPAIVTV